MIKQALKIKWQYQSSVKNKILCLNITSIHRNLNIIWGFYLLLFSNDVQGYALCLIFNLIGLGLSDFSPKGVTTCLGELDEKKPNFFGVILLGRVWASSSKVIWLGRVVLSVLTFSFYLFSSPLTLSSPFSPRIRKLTQIWE